MLKKMIGFGIIAVLTCLLLINVFKSDDKPMKEYDATGDTSVKGGAIMPTEASGIEVGEMAPDFALETLDGKKVHLSDFRGKKIILNFWATWCPPCKKEMPEMQAFYEKHHSEIEVIGINVTGLEHRLSDVEKYIQKNSYTYPILLDKELDVSRKHYMAFSLPTTYFIGTDGIVQQPRKLGPMTYDFMEDMMHALK